VNYRIEGGKSMSTVNLLFELQEYYGKIEKCNKVLKDGSYMYSLKKLRSEFENVKINYNEKCENMKKLKLNIVEISNNIKLQKTQYEKNEAIIEGRVSEKLKITEKMKSKFDSCRQKINELENRASELLENEEKLTDDREKLRQRLLEIKVSFDSNKDAMNKNIINVKHEMDQTNSAIKNISESIPEEVLINFQEIVKKKGNAVVKLRSTICTGCNIKVSSMVIDKLDRGEKIVNCSNCGRILLLDDVDSLKIAK
jgi:uncharacterized protein